jgi:enterochelin esterase family protein
MAERVAPHPALVSHSLAEAMNVTSSDVRLTDSLWILLLTFLTTLARSQPAQKPSFTDSLDVRFRDFYSRVLSEGDSARRQALVEDYLFHVRARGREVTEDSTAYFLFKGHAQRVYLAGDFNGWQPKDTLSRIPQTDLFFLARTFHPAARCEYKFIVDSIWMLDAVNPRSVLGSYGLNSELWMPRYKPPKEIEFRSYIKHGSLDTVRITSAILKRTHTAFVYLPAGYAARAPQRYPTLFVTDGGEYISLALMTNVLDNLIADGMILPIIAVFVDPRTDIHDSQTSKRMSDYTMSSAFVRFMIDEVRARLIKRYRMSRNASQTGIMGASLGGLIATYAAYTRPDVFGLCAAQSPSYWWNKRAMLTMIERGKRRDVKFYIDTGTISDAQLEASAMRDLLARKGYSVHYEEHPESHNWANWRARIARILAYFWGTK